jgi:hypothetical protein
MVQHIIVALKFEPIDLHSSQTGNSVFLLLNPILSANRPIYGPITGTFLAKPAIVPKKSPNRIKMPYSSTTKPTNGHLSKMSVMPPANAAVPLSFCRRAKKSSVFCGPMMMVRPIRKRMLPIASMARSKKRRRPPTRKKMPIGGGGIREGLGLPLGEKGDEGAQTA